MGQRGHKKQNLAKFKIQLNSNSINGKYIVIKTMLVGSNPTS